VVICTHNRREHVPAAVRSLLTQTLSPNLFEILVVDNASTDGTGAALAAEFAAELAGGRLRLAREAEPGVAHARNTGWREARGRIVAYLDDDMRADPDWARRILDIFAAHGPELGCLAGRVLLDWPEAQPAWLSFDLSLCLSRIDWGDAPQALGPDRHFSGGNLALPRRVLEDLGGFPVFLGRVGGKLLSNEEVLLGHMVRERGLTVLYAPAVSGLHFVHPERLRQGWFTRRSFWQGVSEAVMHRHRKGMGRAVRLGTALKVTRDLLRPPEKLAWLLLPTRDARRFDLKCAGFGTLGYMAGLLGLAE